MSIFSASYDRTTQLVSIVAAGLLTTVAIFSPGPMSFVIGALILLAAYAWSPRGYVISGGVLTIKRLAGKAVIPLDDLLDARAASDEDLSGCIRLFGSGGLFGYYGRFRTAKLGGCTWYVTNRAKCVVLITESKAIVVSPDDVDGFLRAVSLSLGRPEWTAPASR